MSKVGDYALGIQEEIQDALHAVQTNADILDRILLHDLASYEEPIKLVAQQLTELATMLDSKRHRDKEDYPGV